MVVTDPAIKKLKATSKNFKFLRSSSFFKSLLPAGSAQACTHSTLRFSELRLPRTFLF